jgi:signal transduction histidine kinase
VIGGSPGGYGGAGSPPVIGGSRGVVPPDGSGHGIRGMSERAASVGGSLTAGPLPEGGFQVKATLPTPAPAPVPAARGESS